MAKQKSEDDLSTNNLAKDETEIRKVLGWLKDNASQKDLALKVEEKHNISFSQQDVSDFKTGKNDLKSKHAKELYETLNDPKIVQINWDEEKVEIVGQINKKPKEENCFSNPTYIIPCIEETQNWDEVINFAEEKKLKKLFVITKLKNSEMLKDIDDESETFSNSDQNFLKNLIDLNGKIKPTDPPKKWKIKINENQCKILMVPKNNELCLRLAREIEEESTELLMKYLDLKRKKNLLNKNKEEDFKKGNLIKEEENQDQEKSKEIFYNNQIEIGTKLFEMIEEKLKETQKNEKVLDLYNDFKFLILLPNKKSLEAQTKFRLEQVKQKFSCLQSEDINSVIRLMTKDTKNDGKNKIAIIEKQWRDFILHAEKNPKVLHLVLHDECHYAAGKNQTSYKLLGFDKGDYHQTTNELKTLLPNLFTLMISATPYDFFALDWLKDEHILKWKSFLNSKGLPSTYQGHSELMNNNKILKHEMQDDKSVSNDVPNVPPDVLKELRLLKINGFSKEFILVLLNYLQALKQYRIQDSSLPDKFKEIENVRRCIDDKKLVVLRVAKAKCNISQSRLARDALLEAIKILEVKLEVWINSEAKIKSEEFKFKFSDHENTVLDKVRVRYPEINIGNLSGKMIFSDVENIPMLMIIVERGRMGDTFPTNCIAFDLRARNTKPGHFTTIIQDVGRVFGYKTRPTLILSNKSYDFLNKLWDKDKDFINLNGLKSELLGSRLKKSKTNDNPNTSYEDEEHIAEIIKDYYNVSEKSPVFLYGLDLFAFKHRIILKAEPQIGKTGAYLYLITLFCKKIRLSEKNIRFHWLNNFKKSVYIEKSLDEIEKWLKTEDGKAEYNEYLKLFKKDCDEEENIHEPAKWAVKVLIQCLEKMKKQTMRNNGDEKTEITLADFSWGDMQFVNFLNEELNNNKMIARHFKIDVFSAGDIQISNQLDNIVLHRMENCIQESKLDEGKFDFVISTCSLWGNGNSWKNIIKNAFHALKTNGIFILAESKEYLFSSMLDSLVYNNSIHIKPSTSTYNSRNPIRLSEKYRGFRMEKSPNYKSEKLLENIQNRPAA